MGMTLAISNSIYLIFDIPCWANTRESMLGEYERINVGRIREKRVRHEA
jgi:hypothetical protein